MEALTPSNMEVNHVIRANRLYRHHPRRPSRRRSQAASDEAAFIQPAGPAERRLHEQLMGLPTGDVRKLVVLIYCGREGTSNVHVADNVVGDPKERLVDQLSSIAGDPVPRGTAPKLRSRTPVGVSSNPKS